MELGLIMIMGVGVHHPDGEDVDIVPEGLFDGFIDVDLGEYHDIGFQPNFSGSRCYGEV